MLSYGNTHPLREKIRQNPKLTMAKVADYLGWTEAKLTKKLKHINAPTEQEIKQIEKAVITIAKNLRY